MFVRVMNQTAEKYLLLRDTFFTAKLIKISEFYAIIQIFVKFFL